MVSASMIARVPGASAESSRSATALVPASSAVAGIEWIAVNPAARQMSASSVEMRRFWPTA